MSHSERELSCRRARVLLEAYLDGELRGPRRAQMDAHLSGCHACAQESVRARHVRTALRELPLQAASPAVMEAVRRQIGARGAGAAAGSTPAGETWSERATRWIARHRPRLQPAFALSIVAIAAAGLYFATHRPADRTVSPEDIRRAETQVRWVLARLGQINERTEKQVREQVFERSIAAPAARAVEGVLDGSVTQ